MSDKRNDHNREHGPVMIDRRKFLVAALGFAAAPLLTRVANGENPVKGPAAQSIRIDVIGAGWLGDTVGRLWVQAGHKVLFSSRHPDDLIPMTRELGPRASAGTSFQRGGPGFWANPTAPELRRLLGLSEGN